LTTVKDISFLTVRSPSIHLALDTRERFCLGEFVVKVLKYGQFEGITTGGESDQRVEQLVTLAKTLVDEIEALQSGLAIQPTIPDTPFDSDKETFDFYKEIEQYEIELIRSALQHCSGNQTHAAKLLGMKSTTLNAKMKHYGLARARS